MTRDFCIVTAVTPEYMNSLYWAAPSWSIKPQFKGRPLLVFYKGIRPEKLDFLRDCFPCVAGVEWDMPGVPQREAMLSAFVLGAAEHVHSEHFVKLDADCYFTTPDDVLTPEDFELDLVAQKWGYTKPAYWLDALHVWSHGGDHEDISREMGRRKDKRIISYLCLHRTEFVRKAAQLCGARMPVPSHDTFLWFLAENCKDFRWASRNWKDKGVHHTPRWKTIREAVCASAAAWNPTHNRELLSHVQLEITTACNLACPNCDRACGIAPSAERMTLEDVRLFAGECHFVGKVFNRIDILGGEPTLHPDLLAILEMVRPFAKRVRLTSNGTGERVKAVLATIPEWVQVRNSAEEKHEPNFEAYNLAPCDSGCTDALACSIPWRCGLALTPGGFFLCGAGAGVSRVFGLGLGIKTFAEVTPERLRKQRAALCRLCGHSRSTVKSTTAQELSPAWEEAVKKYGERR